MPAPAIFGITNSGLNTAVQLVILFLIVIWLALIYYTFSDARRRVEDKMLVGCATLASLFPYAGTLVYMIVRPPEFLEDVREREMEMQAAEARLHQFEYLLCPHCDHEVDKDFLRCPSCMQKLKDACVNCAKPLHPDWKLCPYCETEVGARTPTRARRRRSATRDEASIPPPANADTSDNSSSSDDATEALDSDPPEAPAPRSFDDERGANQLRAQFLTRTDRKAQMDRTLILVKPDAFARGLTGEILARFERKGLRIVAMQHMTATRELAEIHYAEHAERPFFGELVDFITSAPLVALVLEGTDVVKAARQLIGATNPLEAATGSIRGDYAIEVGQNMVHGSDADESAAREIGIWFPGL